VLLDHVGLLHRCADRQADREAGLEQARQPVFVIPPKPDHLNHFSLRPRSGARLVGRLADYREATSLVI
jgi:hypothetical protein